MRDLYGDELMCGPDARLPPELLVPARIEQLAAHGLSELVSKLASTDARKGVIPVHIALPESRPGFASMQLQPFVGPVHFEAEGVSFEITSTLSGHAGALAALARAYDTIRAGQAELMVVGGVDSYLDADTIDWLEMDGRVKREGRRGGFTPGEASSFVALASDRACNKLRLPSLARVVGAGVAQEQRSWSSDEGVLGEGLSESILAACASLQLPADTVTDAYCDINGERLRTDDWGFAVLRAQHVAQDLNDYRTTIGEIGEVGAASGALNCVLAVRQMRRGFARGMRALVVGSSWGGLRAACVLEGELDADSFYKRS